MVSMKSIKNRIKSIENTRQITKAMELVATSKLRKAKERIEKSRPFFNILSDTLVDISNNNKDFSSPFTREPREGEKACHIVIAGDRGLAGGYNNNLFKSVNFDDGDLVFPIGKKAIEFFEHKNVEILCKEYSITEDVSIGDCNAIADELTNAFLKNKFTSLNVFYTGFVNVITQTPESKKILPIIPDGNEKRSLNLTIYEPSPEALFREIVPYYISGMVYGAVCESLASELSARRTAMEAATDNAGEIINELKLKYNRARQSAITQELTEIVAGS